MSAIRGELPDDIEEPIVDKIDFSSLPVVSLAVRSDRMSPRELTDFAEKVVQRRVENTEGVGKVDLVGTSFREVSVELLPDRLEALGLGVDDVIAGLRTENVNFPVGRLNRGGTENPIRVMGKPSDVEGYQSLVIADIEGRAIALGDVARVVDGVEEVRSLALVDGEPAVALDVIKQSGANTVGVVDGIREEIARLQRDVPEGTEVEIVRDASTWIRESVRDVQETLIIGAFLTVFIVFLFLNSWRSTVITGLTLPISVISSFIIMAALGMSLNTMTLMALSLSIGLLIDDAIVVRENIVRHLERGEDHFKAARDGTTEIGLAVLATTMSVIAVFVPVALHGRHRRTLLPRLRDHGGFRRSRLALRVVHPRPHALLALVRPRRGANGQEAPHRARPRPVQRVVRPDGRPLPRRHRVGPRPPEDGHGDRRSRVLRRTRSSSGFSSRSSFPSTTRASSA